MVWGGDDWSGTIIRMMLIVLRVRVFSFSWCVYLSYSSFVYCVVVLFLGFSVHYFINIWDILFMIRIMFVVRLMIDVLLILVFLLHILIIIMFLLFLS